MTTLGRLRADRRLAARSAFLRSLRTYMPAVAIEHAAGTFVLPSDDDTILRKIFLGGGRSDFVVLERALQVIDEHCDGKRGTLVDVGANLGTTTIAALRLHGFDCAVAIEPDPVNVRHLRATIALNGLEDRATVIQAAVSDSVGIAPFSVGGIRSGKKYGAGALSAKGGLSVQTTSLDALLELDVLDAAAVGLVWMDCQGAEGQALAGAARFLKARVPVVAAVRKKRLAKLGGIDLFAATAESAFSAFVDLRAPNLKPDWQPRLQPIAELRAQIDAPRPTDILLLP